MKKKLQVVVAALVVLSVGMVIIGWAVYQGGQKQIDLSKIQHFSDENFEQVVKLSNKLPVLVDFYADWCFPCKMLAPIVEQVARDMEGRVLVGKVDTDKNLIGRRLGVIKLPTLLVIRDGEVKKRFFGVVPKERIVKALEGCRPAEVN